MNLLMVGLVSTPSKNELGKVRHLFPKGSLQVNRVCD
jgi:hypothetical protein